MAQPTIEQIQEKLDKGETLTKEETAVVMSSTDEQPYDVSTFLPEKKEEESSETPEKKGDETPKEQGEKEKTPDETGKSKETPEEKATKKAEEGKAPEPEKKKEGEGVGKARFEQELEKAVGQEDLTGFSPSEKGLFYDLRSERKKRQNLEQEINTLKFRELKRDAEAKKKEEESEDEDELISRKELKKKIEELQTAADDRIRVVSLGIWNREAEKEYGKVIHKVIEAGKLILDEHKTEIQESAQAGGNPILTAFDIITAHSSWPELAKGLGLDPDTRKPVETKKPEEKKPEEKKPAEKEEEAKKVVANALKVKTTAHHPGGKVEVKEITLEDAVAMSDQEFAKLPRTIQNKILEELGG